MNLFGKKVNRENTENDRMTKKIVSMPRAFTLSHNAKYRLLSFTSFPQPTL